MAKHLAKSSVELAPPTLTPGPWVRRRPTAAIFATIVLVIYVAAAYLWLGPAQPLFRQRLLGLGCVLLTLVVYLLFTRPRESHEEITRHMRLAARSDFGTEQLPPRRATRHRTVKLPGLGPTSLRWLGGLAALGLTAAWWLTPLAPVGVRVEVFENMTEPLGQGIAAAVLLVPDGHVAVLAPPIVPPRARELRGRSKKTPTPTTVG